MSKLERTSERGTWDRRGRREWGSIKGAGNEGTGRKRRAEGRKDGVAEHKRGEINNRTVPPLPPPPPPMVIMMMMKSCLVCGRLLPLSLSALAPVRGGNSTLSPDSTIAVDSPFHTFHSGPVTFGLLASHVLRWM